MELADINWNSEHSYGYVTADYGVNGDEPGDCYTRIGYSYRIDIDRVDSQHDYASEQEAQEAALSTVVVVWWYDDGDYDHRGDVYGPYDSEEEARIEAKAHAEGLNEAEEGEDATAMFTRLLKQRVGTPDPTGEWAVYWETSDPSSSRLVAQYETEDAAEAAAELLQRELYSQYPGMGLLAGYGVRVLIGDEWEQV